jgi:hypothetical protein
MDIPQMDDTLKKLIKELYKVNVPIHHIWQDDWWF